MPSKPKVSVVMSIYNGQRFLDQAILSIINQTFTDWELIIVNDCSSDKTLELLNNYLKYEPKIKVINNSKNLGLTRSLNLAINQSAGEYIARIDADDFSDTKRLEKQVLFLDQHPDVSLVGSWAYQIDDLGDRQKELVYPIESVDIKRELIKHNVLIHSSIMFRKTIVNSLGNYDESFKYAQDYDLYLRLVGNRYNIYNLGEFLTFSRKNIFSLTNKKNKAQTLCALRARIKAIKNHTYSFLAVIYLIGPFITLLIPRNLKNKIKLFFKA